MTRLDLSLNPEQIEDQVEELKMMKGVPFSHIALAQSVWNDRYSEFNDSSILGFKENNKDINNKELSGRLWNAIKEEWFQLACTDNEKYKDLRIEIQELKGGPATIIISSIAVALATTLGIAAGVLTPFVAIFLHGIILLGNNTMCRTITQQPEVEL
jgi:hypothetical protein